MFNINAFFIYNERNILFKKGFLSVKSKLSIHYKDKHGVNDKGLVISDYVCWHKIRNVLQSSKTTNKLMAQVKNRGSLKSFVKNKYKFETIGNLTYKSK